MDPNTSKFIDIYNWINTKVNPFDILFGGIENILGIIRENYYKYYTNHYKLRELFYNKLYWVIGPNLIFIEDRKRLIDVKLVGLFLINSWQYKDRIRFFIEEKEFNLYYLDFIFQTIYNRYWQ